MPGSFREVYLLRFHSLHVNSTYVFLTALCLDRVVAPSGDVSFAVALRTFAYYHMSLEYAVLIRGNYMWPTASGRPAVVVTAFDELPAKLVAWRTASWTAFCLATDHWMVQAELDPVERTLELHARRTRQDEAYPVGVPYSCDVGRFVLPGMLGGFQLGLAALNFLGGGKPTHEPGGWRFELIVTRWKRDAADAVCDTWAFELDTTVQPRDTIKGQLYAHPVSKRFLACVMARYLLERPIATPTTLLFNGIRGDRTSNSFMFRPRSQTITARRYAFVQLIDPTPRSDDGDASSGEWLVLTTRLCPVTADAASWRPEFTVLSTVDVAKIVRTMPAHIMVSPTGSAQLGSF